MALVLVPGFMADRDLWADFERYMQEFGPAIHADLGQDDSIVAMARRVIADAPPHFVIIGFSMGGYVAREVARLVPRRVSALILVATSARADTVEQSQRKAAAIKLINQPFKGLSRRAIEESLNPGAAFDGDLVTRVREMGVRLGGDVFRKQSNLIRDERHRTSERDQVSDACHRWRERPHPQPRRGARTQRQDPELNSTNCSSVRTHDSYGAAVRAGGNSRIMVAQNHSQ